MVVLFSEGVRRRGLGQHRALTAPRPLLRHPSISCYLCWLQAGLLLSQLVPPSPTRFMEFEAEDMQIQKLWWIKGAQGLPAPTSTSPDLSEPIAPMVGSQPGRTPSSHGQRQQGLRAVYCPHIGAFIQRDIGLSSRTTLGAEVSGAICHHGL